MPLIKPPLNNLKLHGTLDITLEQIDNEHWVAVERITALGGTGITPTRAVIRLMETIQTCRDGQITDLTPHQQAWLANKFSTVDDMPVQDAGTP